MPGWAGAGFALVARSNRAADSLRIVPVERPAVGHSSSRRVPASRIFWYVLWMVVPPRRSTSRIDGNVSLVVSWGHAEDEPEFAVIDTESRQIDE